jgi:hypothetical protein
MKRKKWENAKKKGKALTNRQADWTRLAVKRIGGVVP